MLLDDILVMKGRDVVCVEPGRTLIQAIALLNERKIGALLVRSSHGIEGILTERDVLRACHTRLAEFGRLTVREVMTTQLVIGKSDDSLDYAMSVMTKRRIRHLPVLESGELCGMISIGDLVNAQLQDADIEIRMLHDYVAGYATPKAS